MTIKQSIQSNFRWMSMTFLYAPITYQIFKWIGILDINIDLIIIWTFVLILYILCISTIFKKYNYLKFFPRIII